MRENISRWEIFQKNKKIIFAGRIFQEKARKKLIDRKFFEKPREEYLAGSFTQKGEFRRRNEKKICKRAIFRELKKKKSFLSNFSRENDSKFHKSAKIVICKTYCII